MTLPRPHRELEAEPTSPPGVLAGPFLTPRIRSLLEAPARGCPTQVIAWLFSVSREVHELVIRAW